MQDDEMVTVRIIGLESEDNELPNDEPLDDTGLPDEDDDPDDDTETNDDPDDPSAPDGDEDKVSNE